MAITSTSTNPEVIKKYFDRLLLDRLESKLWFGQFADKRPLPKNSGKTVEFSRYDNLLPAATTLGGALGPTALSEGAAGAEDAITSSTSTVEVKQYGNHIKVSELWTMTKIDPALKEQVEIMGYNAGLTLDDIVQYELSADKGAANFTGNPAAGSTGYYVGTGFGGSRGGVTAGDLLTADDVRQAALGLRKKDVMPISGSDFVMCLHPVVVSDLQTDSAANGWIEASKYDKPENIFNGEIGKLYGVRFVESSNCKSALEGAASARVYDSFLIGKHAYAMTELSGAGLRMFMSQPQASDSDPLAQVGTIGWKATFAVANLNPDRIIHVVSGSAVAP